MITMLTFKTEKGFVFCSEEDIKAGDAFVMRNPNNLRGNSDFKDTVHICKEVLAHSVITTDFVDENKSMHCPKVCCKKIIGTDESFQLGDIPQHSMSEDEIIEAEAMHSSLKDNDSCSRNNHSHDCCCGSHEEGFVAGVKYYQQLGHYSESFVKEIITFTQKSQQDLTPEQILKAYLNKE